MNKILMLLFFFLSGILLAQDSIRQMSYKLLLADEGNGKVHFVNLANRSETWSVSCSNRDLQLVGNNRVMVSDNGGSGYSEVDISTGKSLRHVAVTGVSSGINTTFRLSEKETYCARDGSPAKIYKTDTTGKILATITLSMDASVRICRPTLKGTFIIGGKTAGMIYEFDSTGKKIWECNAGGEPYMALRLGDGTTLISNGYGGQMVRADQKGMIIRKFPTEADKKSNAAFWSKANPNFYAGFQILPNGTIVVTNWQGHGTGHGSSGYQLIEIDSSLSKVVSYWKQDASVVSSLHNVLVIDDLDTKLLYSDRDGCLKPITSSVGVITMSPFFCVSHQRGCYSRGNKIMDLLGRHSSGVLPPAHCIIITTDNESTSKQSYFRTVKTIHFK